MKMCQVVFSHQLQGITQTDAIKTTPKQTASPALHGDDLKCI